MPAWSLRDDLFSSGITSEVFMPIDASIGAAERYRLEIERETEESGRGGVFEGVEGIRKLVITLDIPSFPIQAVVAGDLTEIFREGTSILRLETEIFDLTAPGDSVCEVWGEALWFVTNWVRLARRIPRAIVYENVSTTWEELGVAPTGLIERVPVRAGQRIGTATSEQIKLSIEYDDSSPTMPRFMHPREFFSLLFWREACDPIYNLDPEPYAHPLLQKMMQVRENGSVEPCMEHTPIHFCKDWLGLRPPLRTYKRIEWEANVEKVRHGENWLLGGNLRGVFQNPVIRENVQCPDKALRSGGTCHGGPYYQCCSKCNIFAGEMAFRAGFKVFVGRSQTDRLAYRSRHVLVPRCDRPEDDRRVFDNPECEIEIEGTSYLITSTSKHCGFRRYVTSENMSSINREIGFEGKAIVHSRKRYCVSGTSPFPPCDNPLDVRGFHIVFLSEIRSVSPTGITASIIDQHIAEHPLMPYDCDIPSCGCQSPTARAFIELRPGGDPTEYWGVLDLNCLEEVTSG